MILLDELKAELRAAVDNYETSRPFKRKPSALRAADVTALTRLIDGADCAVALKTDMESCLEAAKVGAFSFMALLDLHALKVRVSRVFKQKKYADFKLMHADNLGLRQVTTALEGEVSSLRGQLKDAKTLSPERFSELEEKIAVLRDELDVQRSEQQRFQKENKVLQKKLMELQQDCDRFRDDAVASEKKYELLNSKYKQVLQDNRRLKAALAARAGKDVRPYGGKSEPGVKYKFGTV